MGCGSSKDTHVIEPTITRPPTPEPSIHSVDLPDVEDSYPSLSTEVFLAKFLSMGTYNQLCSVWTAKGFSLDDIIQTELDYPTPDGRNLVVPDGESYTKFEAFLTPLVSHYHSTSDMSGGLTINSNVDPDALTHGKHLRESHFVSCCFSTRRSIAEYPSPAMCIRLQRRELYDILTHALTISQPDYQGKACLLEFTSQERSKELLSCSCQFDTPNSSPSVAAGASRDWPEARGLWVDSAECITAHINTSDHLHLNYHFNPSNCSNLYEAFVSFFSSLTQLEQALQYHQLTLSHHPTLGFLSSSLLHIGACMDLTVTLDYPTLSKCVLFDDILRSVGFEEAQRKDNSGLFSLTYSHHFGVSEVEFLQQILDRADKMAAIEELYSQEENFYHLLPPKVQQGSGKHLVNFPTFKDKTVALAKLLTIDRYLQLVPLTTPHGFSLDHALQYGKENPTDPFWFILGDSHTLHTFGSVLSPVLEGVLGNTTTPPPLSGATPLLLNGGRGLSYDHTHFCYITAQRNFTKFPFSSQASASSQTALNDAITHALSNFPSRNFRDFPLKAFMEENGNHFLAVTGSSLLSRPHHVKDAAGGGSEAAGSRVWINQDSSLILVSNQEQHLTIIVSSEGGNMQSVYEHFLLLYPQLGKSFEQDGLEYATAGQYGFMTIRPHDFSLVTSSGVLLHLPALSSQLSRMNNMLTSASVSATSISSSLVHLSSKTSLCECEHEVVQRVIDAALRMIDLDAVAMKEGTVLQDEDFTLIHPDFPDLCDRNNLLAHHLSPRMYSHLVNHVTSTGWTLDSVIQVGVDKEGCDEWDPGIVAGDADCYDVFGELFDPIINHIHSCDSHVIGKSAVETGGIQGISSISQVKIKLRGNLRGYPFPPNCTRAERTCVESLLSAELRKLDGRYYLLRELPSEVSHMLTERNFFAKEPAFPAFVSSSIIRDWPESRGVWISQDCSIAAFINGEDHVCLTSVSEEGDLVQAYSNLHTVFTSLQDCMENGGHQFAAHKKYGLLTTSPSHAGCGMSVECTVHLPLLSGHPWMAQIASSQKLKLVDATAGSKVTCSSVRSIGVSERELLRHFKQSIKELRTIEKLLTSGACLYNTPHHLASKEVAVNESNFPDFSMSPSSPLALSLSEDMYSRLSAISTPMGTKLEDVIALGLYDPAHPVGVVLCDSECFSIFLELYHCVLRNTPPGIAYHSNGHKLHLESTIAPSPILDDKFVSVSYEYRYNLTTFPFPPKLTRKERQEVEEILQEILPLTGSDTGRYLSLRHFARKKDLSFDRSLLGSLTAMPEASTGMTRDWPWNRGVYLTDVGVFAAINISNHLIVSVTSHAEDLTESYRKLIDISKLLEDELTSRGHSVAFSRENGYLNTCPTRCGSGLRIVAKLRLPKLARHPKSAQILKSLCMRMSKTLFVNEVTGESDNIAEVEFIPGHNLPEDESVAIFFSSLEQVCKIESSLQLGRKKKWSSVPWPAFGTKHVKL